jgi:hypothetical protein
MRRGCASQWLLLLAVGACGSSAEKEDTCQPDDADGIIGGSVTFDVTIDDTGFTPAILPAQNATKVTLTLHNMGTKPHDFVIDCLPTPNDHGCPMTSCFPPTASIPTVAPGATATSMFVTPTPEGIYYYHSDLPGDAAMPCSAGAQGCGQFQVK